MGGKNFTQKTRQQDVKFLRNHDDVEGEEDDYDHWIPEQATSIKL